LFARRRIAIAKRIEAGRELMIGALCEGPLTFEALTVWRDELMEGKALLRDIIDLEAMYGGMPARKACRASQVFPARCPACPVVHRRRPERAPPVGGPRKRSLRRHRRHHLPRRRSQARNSEAAGETAEGGEGEGGEGGEGAIPGDKISTTRAISRFRRWKRR